MTMPLSLALGNKDSLLDQKSIGQIQDVLAKKTDVPHEIRVCPSIFGVLLLLADGRLAMQIYEGHVHGFALRSDWGSDKRQEGDG
jgi:hypothetical protein